MHTTIIYSLRILQIVHIRLGLVYWAIEPLYYVCTVTVHIYGVGVAVTLGLAFSSFIRMRVKMI